MINQIVYDNLSNGASSVHVDLIRPKYAEILWTNPRFCKSGNDDPINQGSFESRILKECAYLYQPDSREKDEAGYFDRYGGPGVGRNGGSGRAVNIGFFNVKGVGRSPLVGQATDLAHASGFALVEESLREIINSERLEKIIPGRVAPIIAVIGINEPVRWPAGIYPAVEWRVLIVRERLARPAHLCRSISYDAISSSELVNDSRRVSFWREIIFDSRTESEIIIELSELLRKWARDYAICLCNRWSLGGLSASNIDFDGRILDFGGLNRVPSLANFAAGHSAWTWTEINTIIRTAKYLAADFFGEVYSPRDIAPISSQLVRPAMDEFLNTLSRQFGLERPPSKRLLTGDPYQFLEENNWLVSQVVEHLSSINVPIGVAAGPQLVDVQMALAEWQRFQEQHEINNGFRDYLKLKLARSSSKTARNGDLEPKGFFDLRSLLMREIGDGCIRRKQFEDIVLRYIDMREH